MNKASPTNPMFDESAIMESLRNRIGVEQLTFSYTRSGGPGGQNVNKVNTRVTLWFNLAASLTLTDKEKHTLRERLGGRITADGRLHLVSMRHRTQLANRKAAVERFYELLAAALRPRPIRKPTQAPRGARERRLRDKQEVGRRKRLRTKRSIERFED